VPVALIVGAFGQDNPGDEALLDATVGAVRGHPGWEPIVATGRPVETTERLGVEAFTAGAAATLRAAARSDALVVGGGTLFKELHPASGRAPGALLRNALALATPFRLRRRPVALLGVGASRIVSTANRRLARSLAVHADLLVLRDPDSAVLLAELGVPTPLRVGADLTWLGAELSPPAAHASMGAIGVAVSHLAAGPGTVERLADGLRPLLDAGRPIELEPWQGSQHLSADAAMARRIQRGLGDGATVLRPPQDLSEAVARMAGRSAAVTLRFHAAVAAAMAGTSFVAFAHEPKLAAIARRLGQQAITCDAAAEAITHGLRRTLLGPVPAADAIAEERHKAAATADLLGLVLTAGDDADHVIHLDELAHLDLVPAPVPA
jgi:polysaccharide pyruvyl transferase WcaK-like protein